MLLDRGQELDWFSSREIIVEAVIAGLALYLFVVHMFTADRPFLPPGLFKDRNFASGMVMVFCVSSLMLSTSALLAPYLQNLAGYPVYTAGWVMAPRGFGIIASMFLAARMGMRVDQRKIMAVGLRAARLGALHHEHLDTRCNREFHGFHHDPARLFGGPGVQSNDGDGLHDAVADVAWRGHVDAIAGA